MNDSAARGPVAEGVRMFIEGGHEPRDLRGYINNLLCRDAEAAQRSHARVEMLVAYWGEDRDGQLALARENVDFVRQDTAAAMVLVREAGITLDPRTETALRRIGAITMDDSRAVQQEVQASPSAELALADQDRAYLAQVLRHEYGPASLRTRDKLEGGATQFSERECAMMQAAAGERTPEGVRAGLRRLRGGKSSGVDVSRGELGAEQSSVPQLLARLRSGPVASERQTEPEATPVTPAQFREIESSITPSPQVTPGKMDGVAPMRKRSAQAEQPTLF